MVAWVRRMAWGAGAVLLLWAIAWLALPALIQWQAPARLSEALGRTVTIGDVRFEPWSLALTMSDIAIAGGPAARAPLLRVRRMRADVSALTLFRRAPVIESLEIDAPQLWVARTGEGHYDVDDLIARFTPRADAPASEPARFALYNLQVRDAQLRFDDQPVRRVHQVEALQLALPFVSNLPAEVEVKVEPRLAFKLNGTPFDSGAQATPFAPNKTGALTLRVADLDIAPYLGYLPASLPMRFTRGSVSADLSLQFLVPQQGPATLALKGTIDAKELAMSDPAGRPVLDWRHLQLALLDVQPLARKLAFETLRVDGLKVHASRDAAGRINLLSLAAANSASEAAHAAATAAPLASPPADAAASAAASGTVATARAAPVWQFSLESLDIADARVLWNDAAVTPAAEMQIDGLRLAARQLQWPIARPIAVSLSGAVHARGAVSPALAEFSVDGPLTDRIAKLNVKIAGLSLGAFAPYLAQVLVPSVGGQLAAQAQLDWSGTTDAPRLRIEIDSASVDSFTLREALGRGTQDAIALKRLTLGTAQIDMLSRSVELGSIRVMQPSVALRRDPDGRLNLQRWLRESPPSARAYPADADASALAQPTWRVRLKDLLLEGGQIEFADALARRDALAPAEPLRVALADVRVAVQGLDWHGVGGTVPASLQFSARIGGPQRDRSSRAGTIDYTGRVGIEPLLTSGRLRVARLPVQVFAPYFADQIQLRLLRADTDYIGNVSVRQLPSGLGLQAAGDLRIGDVHVAGLADSNAPSASRDPDELLSWQMLALKGVKLTMQPKARPQVEIGEAALSDFYSRLVITEQGRFNLQDFAAAPVGATPAAVAASAVRVPSAASAPASTSADASPAPPLDLKLGVTTLRGGRIDFTDRFVRPNYSAALTELNGQLGAFSSGSREMATLELRGRAAGTARLEIDGQLNPMARPLALDIRARATDLELAPLSPYAGKYAGYAIERGKLSMQVAYKIDADGKLEAKNQIVLNQLTFGDKIESKDATTLPVLLAVALLKDRNGVIDLNLPVSGSISDPKFSVAGIIVKVIGDLLARAITAPFALLSGGGGDDLSLVEFEPGTAFLAPAGASAIDKVAKALDDRPNLKMTVTGAADPASERDAFQLAAIEARLLAERRREALRVGGAGAAASAPPALLPDERSRLLKQLYKDTDIPNKPRNAIGFAKDIPAPEMETLLKSRMLVTIDAMRDLALQRGVAVRDALIAKGLASERLFLAAPKLRTSDDGDAAWTPRVQLALSVD